MARTSSPRKEIGLFGRLGLKPVVFVLNNNGYLIERLLCKDPGIAYNDIAPWRYTGAAACAGLRRLVHRPCRHLRRVRRSSRTEPEKADSGVYIEVVTGTYAASPLAKKLGEGLKALAKA